MKYNIRKEERLELLARVSVILGSVIAIYFFIIMLVNLN